MRSINLFFYFIFSLQVNCVAFSPDFEIMVTGSDDERVRIFNAVTGKLVCKLKGHTGLYRSQFILVCDTALGIGVQRSSYKFKNTNEAI